jgi:hypothetical protein
MLQSPVEADSSEAASCCFPPFSGKNSDPRPRMGEEDPLTLAMLPPPNETPEQRFAREQAEVQAKKISDEIDEQIRREKENERRKKRPVKLLLLGMCQPPSLSLHPPPPPLHSTF